MGKPLHTVVYELHILIPRDAVTGRPEAWSRHYSSVLMSDTFDANAVRQLAKAMIDRGLTVRIQEIKTIRTIFSFEDFSGSQQPTSSVLQPH